MVRIASGRASWVIISAVEPKAAIGSYSNLLRIHLKKGATSWLKVKWTHTSQDEPILIYSEIDGDRFETRKVEYFIGGAVGLASRRLEKGSTQLGSVPVPEIAKINEDSEFEAEEISEDEFNSIWDVYV